MYSLFVDVIRHEQKFVQRTSWQVIWMLVRLTIQNDETRNFKRHQASWVESLESRQIDFCCCEYRLFRCNTSLRYSKVLSVLWDRELSATISTMSTSISWVRFVDFVVRTSSRFDIDLIQTTKRKETKRKRSRQEESKRVTRSLDHCIFCEITFRIFDSNLYFCFSSFVTISLVSELLRVLLVLDSLVATQLVNLQESRLQAMRWSLRIKQQVTRACASTSCEEDN